MTFFKTLGLQGSKFGLRNRTAYLAKINRSDTEFFSKGNLP